ncbi:MAG: phosphatidylserine decarboxylase [Verrucomicrobiae bacterium]|nr:phosphatidylserine decarboxylase [Verrucomicrobiae bacterium]MCX7915541.1 phosphatidylserine decarboxylase [Verrucomicrobiae bacterium]MDW8345041.1 phosphatidylserine decarboxylase [Verrucomicrobiae bacterium]
MFTARTLWEGRWPLGVLAVLSIAGWLWCWSAFALSFALLLFTLWFFRDPERTPPQDPLALVAPADGRVTDIQAGTDGTQTLGIFLSVFDVHVQRAPLDGVIADVRYEPGKFHDARDARASTENEKRTIVLESADGYRLVVRQIAGLIARRIVGWKEAGNLVQRGERIGMIRFGSRVELTLPVGTEITARVGQHVKGGETIVARRPAAAR